MTELGKQYLDLVRGPALRTPDSVAVIAPGQRITFRELDDRIGRLGAGLREHGLVPGDRVAILSANELEYLEIQGACLRSGFTMVPLNTRLAEPELAYIVGNSAPNVLIGGRDQHARLAPIARQAGNPTILGLGSPADIPSYDEVLLSTPADPEADPLDPDLNTTFLYTSGTTGRPKGQ